MRKGFRATASSVVQRSPALYGWINRRRYERLHEPTADVDFEVIGSRYGGWPVIDGSLDETSLVYSVGVGFDISFDLGVIARFGCKVLALDPTPFSAQWVAGQGIPDERFDFRPIGLAGADGVVDFVAPENDPSCFSKPQTIGAEIGARCRVARLSTLVAENGGRVPDLLKMDIEGFEYEVLMDVLEGDVLPAQLAVEFHHGLFGIPNSATIDVVDRALLAGYEIFYISDIGREYGFVLRN